MLCIELQLVKIKVKTDESEPDNMVSESLLASFPLVKM